MRMNAMLRVLTGALVLGALALNTARGAEEPVPINITSANLQTGLSADDIKQVKAHADYWLSELVQATSAGGVYAAREGLLADYNKYGNSIRYKIEFARIAAAAMPAAMDKLTKGDRHKALKEVNFALAISKMPRLTSISALNKMVAHANPGVRFLAWKGFGQIRNEAIRAAGSDVKILSAALKRHAATDTSPMVAEVIVDVLYIKKAERTTEAFRKAFDQNFKILTAMLKTSTSRLAAGDSNWARPCLKAIGFLTDANEFYKPDGKAAILILQQSLDIAYAGALAFDKAGAIGQGAFHCRPLLLQAERAIVSLSGKKDTADIRIPLLSKKTPAEQKRSAVRRGVLEWVARLEDVGVKTPRFSPPKAPVATTQPTAKPAS